MRVTVIKKEDVFLQYVKVQAEPRYWCDCEYSLDNGKTWIEPEDDTKEADEKVLNDLPSSSCIDEDDEGKKYLNLLIDIEDGRVINWPDNVWIKMRFKVCDDARYAFWNRDLFEVICLNDDYGDDYVPDFLDLEGNGYGDYLEINISNGKIEHLRKMQDEIQKYFKDKLNEH